MHNQQMTLFLDRPLEDDGMGRLLIPDGAYVAQIKDWRTFQYMGEPRVEFTFEIQEGLYKNTHVGFFTGVKALIGKAAIRGEFIPAGRQSNLGKALRSIEQLSGKKPTIRRFIEANWVIQVITIKVDSRRHPLEERDWYSKVNVITPTSLNPDW